MPGYLGNSIQKFWKNGICFKKFLQKELPAVPLEKRLRIKHPVTTQEMETLIAKLLARKITTITFINQPGIDQNKKDQMVTMMLTTIYHDQTIEWNKSTVVTGAI